MSFAGKHSLAEKKIQERSNKIVLPKPMAMHLCVNAIQLKNVTNIGDKWFHLPWQDNISLAKFILPDISVKSQRNSFTLMQDLGAADWEQQ